MPVLEPQHLKHLLRIGTATLATESSTQLLSALLEKSNLQERSELHSPGHNYTKVWVLPPHTDYDILTPIIGPLFSTGPFLREP